MIKYILLAFIFIVCKANSDTQPNPYQVSQKVEVLCYKGIEYLTKNDWKNGYTVAVDKYNKPITCTDKSK